MAILGFHFSSIFRNGLLNGSKNATIMDGENYFREGQEVLVYLSDKPNLFDGRIEKRIGRAKITKFKIKHVNDLTIKEAKQCGYKNLQELKSGLEKWYNCDKNSIITFIKFNLLLD